MAARVKAPVAAVPAWVIARRWLEAPLPFIAPSADPPFLAVYADVLDHGAAVVSPYRGPPPRTGPARAAADPGGGAAPQPGAPRAAARPGAPADAWMIHGPPLIEIDRLLDGLATYLREPADAPAARRPAEPGTRAGEEAG